MAFSLDDQEADGLARQVAILTGETLAKVVRGALRLRLRHEQLKRGERLWDEAEIDAMVDGAKHRQQPVDDAAIDAIIAQFNGLPLLDDRTADEIVGYDETGLPN